MGNIAKPNTTIFYEYMVTNYPDIVTKYSETPNRYNNFLISFLLLDSPALLLQALAECFGGSSNLVSDIAAKGKVRKSLYVFILETIQTKYNVLLSPSYDDIDATIRAFLVKEPTYTMEWLWGYLAETPSTSQE